MRSLSVSAEIYSGLSLEQMLTGYRKIIRKILKIRTL